MANGTSRDLLAVAYNTHNVAFSGWCTAEICNLLCRHDITRGGIYLFLLSQRGSRIRGTLGRILCQSLLSFKIADHHICVARNAVHLALIRILPRIATSRILWLLRHGVCNRRIMCHPHLVISFDGSNIPRGCIGKLVSSTVKHSLIACKGNGLQKSSCVLSPLLSRYEIHPAALGAKSLAVIYNRIGYGVSGNVFDRPASFLLSLSHARCSREEIHTKEKSRLLCLLQIVVCRLVLYYLPVLASVPYSDIGKIHTGRRHGVPVYPALPFGNVDTL